MRRRFRAANVLPCRMLRRNQIARPMGKDLSSGPDRVPRPLCRSVWRWWWRKKWNGRRAVSMRRRKILNVGGGRECGVDCDEAKWVQCCTDGSVDGGQGFSVLLLMIACAFQPFTLASLARSPTSVLPLRPDARTISSEPLRNSKSEQRAFIRPPRDNTAVASPDQSAVQCVECAVQRSAVQRQR